MCVVTISVPRFLFAVPSQALAAICLSGRNPLTCLHGYLVVHLVIGDAEHYCHASTASRLFRNAHGDPLHVFKNGVVFLLLSYLGCWCILKAVPHQVYDLQIFIKVSLFLLAFDLHHPSWRA